MYSLVYVESPLAEDLLDFWERVKDFQLLIYGHLILPYCTLYFK